MALKKIHRYFMLKPIAEIVEHFKMHERNFDVRLTNYSIGIETTGRKYHFADEPMSAQAFAMHSVINKDVGGEIRPVPDRIKYFDFSGLKKNPVVDHCYCVDINSAYLKALEIENVITKETFESIDKKSRASKHSKINRLKAVGLFARAPTLIYYRGGEVEEMKTIENPFSWVFFQACKTTGDMMEKIKKIEKSNYLLYWVDGIFLKENPQRAADYLNAAGFQCKIEKIENLRVLDGCVIYEKEGKTKFLFLPQSEKTANREFVEKINSAKEI